MNTPVGVTDHSRAHHDQEVSSAQNTHISQKRETVLYSHTFRRESGTIARSLNVSVYKRGPREGRHAEEELREKARGGAGELCPGLP